MKSIAQDLTSDAALSESVTRPNIAPEKRKYTHKTSSSMLWLPASTSEVLLMLCTLRYDRK